MAEVDADEAWRIVQRALTLHGASATASLSVELDTLFAHHQPMLRSLCRRLVSDPQRAEEIAQDAQLVAYGKLAEFERGRRFSTWVYGIARNLALNAGRRRVELLAEDGVLEGLDGARGVLSSMLADERDELLRAASAAVLDPQEQEAVHLRYGEGLSQEQITEILGLEGTGARGLLQRCRRKLARELERLLTERGHGPSFLNSSG